MQDLPIANIRKKILDTLNAAIYLFYGAIDECISNEVATAMATSFIAGYVYSFEYITGEEYYVINETVTFIREL